MNIISLFGSFPIGLTENRKGFCLEGGNIFLLNAKREMRLDCKTKGSISLEHSLSQSPCPKRGKTILDLLKSKSKMKDKGL